MSDNKSNTNKTKSENDILKDFIKNNENTHQPTDNINTPNRKKVDYIETTADSKWINVDLSVLPYNKFYKVGTKLFIRPATTAEIEAFAIVNEKNPYDVQLRLNEILKSCSKLVFMDGSTGDYKDLQAGDRDTLAIIISKASKKNGRTIAKHIKCSGCDTDNDIEFIPANYVYVEEHNDLKEWFNNETRVYEFELENGVNIKLAPPTIGLSESVNQYIFYQTTKSEGTITPNVTFMQTITYIKGGLGITDMSIEQLEQEEYNFKLMNEDLFQFVYDAIDLMAFGIQEVKHKCTNCGKEMKTPFRFPDGPRALFIIPNAFKQFIRK